mgnify:CR=1 FL=1
MILERVRYRTNIFLGICPVREFLLIVEAASFYFRARRSLFRGFTMRRFLIACVLFATCGLLGTVVEPTQVVASGDPAPAGTYDVGGTIYAINWEYGYVIIETQKGCYQAIYPDGNTVVTVKGAPATLLSMAVGNRIRSNNSLTTGHSLYIDLR